MRWLWVLALSMALVPVTAFGKPSIDVGSKAFPESWILAEAVRIELEQASLPSAHQRNLGGTEIVYQALRSGAIDVYPEYTGTIAEVLLKQRGIADLDELRAGLAPAGLTFGAPLGFNNGYAIAVSRAAAARCSLKTLSELQRCKPFRLGLSHEFLGRSDGYRALSAHYGLELEVRGMQHELSYEAVASGAVDGIDVYTTDPQIDNLQLAVLEDDRRFFPRYDAVLLYRRDLPPAVVRVLAGFAGRIDESTMRKANAAVVLRRESVESAARSLLGRAPGAAQDGGVADEIVAHTARHLELVLAALGAAIFLGVPLGIWSTRSRWLRAVVLTGAGLLQTIPSLALLSLLIPLLGIGFLPSLVALFVYSLLPILRNTCVGMASIPALYLDAARAIGLSRRTRLVRVELPMALPTLLAGIRTSAVISVGTATLAALIGAGGLGSPILEGISLRDTGLILRGAVPVALLALLIDGLFAALERWITPRGLRISSQAL
jgi:osmoprotectant transport system permease protein